MSTSHASNGIAERRITTTPEPARVRVTFRGTVVADTVRAIRLQEAAYPMCYYIPRDDCMMEFFKETTHQTKCPFKGTARYWTLSTKDGEAVNAVWGYDDPFDQVAIIDRHVAFYPNLVEISVG